MQHTNARLLPWHRVFLHLFEEALHNYHPDVCVPYWDWTKESEQKIPDWLAAVLPTVVKNHNVQTDVLCTNVGSTPVDVGLEVFDQAGQRDVLILVVSGSDLRRPLERLGLTFFETNMSPSLCPWASLK